MKPDVNLQHLLLGVFPFQSDWWVMTEECNPSGRFYWKYLCSLPELYFIEVIYDVCLVKLLGV